ncbi:MAG: hypothetical protein FK734_12105 [Asgard group archaeon]|nr:hypothetical protein [Asgard group archaeon]
MTSKEIEGTRLAEKFYNSIRGFIVIEESGLPKYIEFLTEEQVDVILIAGLLTGLQALAEVISEEKIKSIETSNSKFIFEMREQYFYVLWIEKKIANIDLYESYIMKIISRFEGASSYESDNTLLISNLTETPDYEKFGQRLVRHQTEDSKYNDFFAMLLAEGSTKEELNVIQEQFSGIDGVLIISNEGKIIHSEFPRGKPIFDIPTLTNFLVGLRMSFRNLDPSYIEEITTPNYRFIIKDHKDYFYVFEVIKNLVNEAKLENTIQRIISRYEGLRHKVDENIVLLKNLGEVPEHELLGQLSLEMRELKEEPTKGEITSLQRQASRISFGTKNANWSREEEQLYNFMDIFTEIFMVGIVTPKNRFFIMKKVMDANDWIDSANNLEIEKLLALTQLSDSQHPTKLKQGDKDFLLLRITDSTVLFVLVENSKLALENFMLRLPKVLQRISQNLT